MSRYALAAFPLILSATALVAGCPGEITDFTPFQCNIEEGLFKASCTNPGCHTSKNPAGSLDLQSPNVTARLVGKPGSQDCPGTLVDPNDPEGSVLYKKLTPGFCGVSQMPMAMPPLSDTEL